MRMIKKYWMPVVIGIAATVAWFKMLQPKIDAAGGFSAWIKTFGSSDTATT